MVKHEHLFVDDLYNDKPDGHYWYQGGFNPAAVKALIVGAVVGMVFVFVPRLHFLGASPGSSALAVGGGTYWWLMRRAGAGAARAERARFKAAQA